MYVYIYVHVHASQYSLQEVDMLEDGGVQIDGADSEAMHEAVWAHGAFMLRELRAEHPHSISIKAAQLQWNLGCFGHVTCKKPNLRGRVAQLKDLRRSWFFGTRLWRVRLAL